MHIIRSYYHQLPNFLDLPRIDLLSCSSNFTVADISMARYSVYRQKGKVFSQNVEVSDGACVEAFTESSLPPIIDAVMPANASKFWI